MRSGLEWCNSNFGSAIFNRQRKNTHGKVSHPSSSHFTFNFNAKHLLYLCMTETFWILSRTMLLRWLCNTLNRFILRLHMIMVWFGLWLCAGFCSLTQKSTPKVRHQQLVSATEASIRWVHTNSDLRYGRHASEPAVQSAAQVLRCCKDSSQPNCA